MVGKNLVSGDKYAKYKVGDATQITLVRAIPGYEQEIASKLCNDLPEASIYKLFGVADFGIIQRFDDRPIPLTLTKDCRKYVTDINTVDCFNWQNLDSVEFSEAKLLPCVGICFLKANSDFLCDSGIVGEHLILNAIKDAINTKMTNIQIGVYGTLGWFETLLIIYSQSMAKVLLFANNLRQAVISRSQKDGNRILPCFETTFTIPAIICRNGDIPANIELEPSISLEVHVSCHSWADSDVYNKLHELLGTPHYIAGTDDFVINKIKPKSLSDYVHELWKFRKKTADEIYGTRTGLIIRTPKKRTYYPPISRPETSRLGINFNNSELIRLKETSPTIYQMFSEIYARMNDFLLDFQKRSVVNNLLPFAKGLLDAILNPKPELGTTYIDNPKVLGQMLEMLLFGLQQRSVGLETCESTWVGGTPHIGGSGGIQRVLLALSSIPTSIISQTKRIWPGFTVIGWANTYYRYLGGVINIPAETLYKPNLWFGVFHEVGHEHFSQADLANDPRIAKALADQGLYSEENILEVSEIYSEIFACLFGFNNDFDKCLKTTWQYLISLPALKERLPGLFVRFLLAYIFMLEYNSKVYINTTGQFIKVAKEIRKKLVDFFGQTVWIDDPQLRKLSSTARKLRVALDIIRELMPQHDAVQKGVTYPGLSRGRIPTKIQSPVRIIQDLILYNQEPSYKQSIAAILSLWSYQIQTSRE